MKKRGSFLLIELLVALTLLAIVGSQFLRPSHQFAKSQRNQLELIQLGRYGKEQLLRVKMEILAQKIRPPLAGECCSGELPPLTCLSLSGESQLFQCQYILKRKRISQKEGKRRGNLFSLQLTFLYKNSAKACFTYPLFIEEVIL